MRPETMSMRPLAMNPASSIIVTIRTRRVASASVGPVSTATMPR
ncbi:hypothetical protein ACFPRL_23460 [Pseudoclavibacter helvolus]